LNFQKKGLFFRRESWYNRTKGGGFLTTVREKVFPALSGFLWTAFLLLDWTGFADSTWIKFAGICLCFTVSLTGLSRRDGRLVAAAQGLTVCADVCLLLLDRSPTDRLIGVIFFLGVQFLYAARLSAFRCGQAAARLAGFLAGAAIALFFRDVLTGLSLFYFVNLCLNAVMAFQWRVPKPRCRFRWGLLLFVCCDLCVGAWNLGLFGDFARVGMWLFYLPSQTWIVLSQDVGETFQSTAQERWMDTFCLSNETKGKGNGAPPTSQGK